MPVSILTSLVLWSSLLAPASGIDSTRSVNLDRPTCCVADEHSAASIWSWPLSSPCSWTYLDADTEEEETGDGDPEGLASDAAWISPRLFSEGSVPSIRRDRFLVCQPTRSKILRC
jgi:hypothetical protein